MQREKAVAHNTAILMLGKICTQGISFVLFPLYTSILSQEEYGIFDLMITYSTLFLPLVNWQFDQGVFRFLLDHRGDDDGIKTVFSTVLFSCIIQTIAYACILLAVNYFHPVQHLLFLLIYVSLLMYTGLLLQFSRGIGSSKTYAVASFISATMTVVLNVITLVILHLGVQGLFLSCIIGQLSALAYLSIKNSIWRYINLKNYDRSTYRQISRYSIPLIPNNLAWWVVNASDRMVINHYIGIAANGIYTVACKFPNLFITFYNIVNLSWTESVSLHFNDDDRDTFLNEVMMVFFKLFSSCCFMIIALMPFVFPIMVNIKFSISYNHIYILMMAMLFRVLVGLYSCIYVAQKQSGKVATTSIAAAIINLSVDLILVGKIELYAASVSTLVAFLVMFIVRYIDVNRSINLKIETKSLILTLALGICLGIVYYSGNQYCQLITLVLVLIYSIGANYKTIKAGGRLVRRFFQKS